MSARHDVCRRLRRLDRGVRHPNPECNKPRPFTHETALYPLKTCTENVKAGRARASESVPPL